MATSMGRSFKREELIKELKDDQLYKPSTIANIPDLSHLTMEKQKRVRKQIRLSMSRLSRSRCFPACGDGALKEKGQAVAVGWWGWRWRNALNLVILK